MHEDGDDILPSSEACARRIADALYFIPNISIQKMFGGYGVFQGDLMFAIVDRKGQGFFKTNDPLLVNYHGNRGTRHSRMPYSEIPDDLWEDQEELIKWAQKAMASNRN